VEHGIRTMAISLSISTTSHHPLVPTHPAHAEHPLPKPQFRLNHSPQARRRGRVIEVRNGLPADFAARRGGGGHAVCRGRERGCW
jgi:hypothetical protein